MRKILFSFLSMYGVRIHVDRTILAVPFYCSSFFVTCFGAGGRTRLHLIDFGCCERTKTTGGSITQAHTHTIYPREKIRHFTIVKIRHFQFLQELSVNRRRECETGSVGATYNVRHFEFEEIRQFEFEEIRHFEKGNNST
jgi:hypothetical protein